jgi:CRP-like cAMP-binding protein
MDVLGSLSFVPRHIISVDQLTRMQLDHHAGFLLTLVDGVLSFETIVDVCGMPRADALRVLADLVRRGVIST